MVPASSIRANAILPPLQRLGYWDEHRFFNGTETHELGEILASKMPMGD